MMQEKANILLVDDHLSNLVALEGMLESLNQNLVRASSGEEALLRLLEQEFAVILMDVQMGSMDGFETVAIIKQRDRSKSIPIIFITAIHRNEEHVYRGYSSGAVDYLFKPVVPEILRAKVSVFVELYHKTREIQTKTTELEAINKEFQQQLTQVQILNRKLEAVNLELESFSYSVSHDLRAPLRSIKGFSQALLRSHDAMLNADGRDFLKRIIDSCEQMSGLIEDLLQLSRVIRGRMDIQRVDLTELANNVFNDLQRTLPERTIQFTAQQGMMAEGDIRLLRVVLDNLIGNAWKFTRYTQDARIEFGSELQNGQTIYVVRDNGAGFDMEFSHQLFQAFHRLHNESEFEGNGVGLATVQRIIHRHGGEIWAAGEVGKGASFYFTLGDPGA
jgi:two-component system, sensor histidine kinase and response regulator